MRMKSISSPPLCATNIALILYKSTLELNKINNSHPTSYGLWCTDFADQRCSFCSLGSWQRVITNTAFVANKWSTVHIFQSNNNCITVVKKCVCIFLLYSVCLYTRTTYFLYMFKDKHIPFYQWDNITQGCMLHCFQ